MLECAAKIQLVKMRNKHLVLKRSSQESQILKYVNTVSAMPCFLPLISKYYLQLKGDHVVCVTHSWSALSHTAGTDSAAL